MGDQLMKHISGMLFASFILFLALEITKSPIMVGLVGIAIIPSVMMHVLKEKPCTVPSLIRTMFGFRNFFFAVLLLFCLLVPLVIAGLIGLALPGDNYDYMTAFVFIVVHTLTLSLASFFFYEFATRTLGVTLRFPDGARIFLTLVVGYLLMDVCVRLSQSGWVADLVFGFLLCFILVLTYAAVAAIILRQNKIAQQTLADR